MNEMKLKPCPFCGGKAKFSLFLCRETIVCTECPACIVPPIIGAYSKGELAAEWNGRAEQTEHGRWIDAHFVSGGDFFRCSECGCYIEKPYFANDYNVRYCPNCGARMDGGADNG